MNDIIINTPPILEDKPLSIWTFSVFNVLKEINDRLKQLDDKIQELEQTK
jgi:hypothetical protein